MTKAPPILTGTAVGVVSTIGFVPEMIRLPARRQVRRHFGASVGYRHYLNLLAGIPMTVTLSCFGRGTGRAGTERATVSGDAA